MPEEATPLRDEDEVPAGETYQQRVNKQMRREIEEADQRWVRAQSSPTVFGRRSSTAKLRLMMAEITPPATWSVAIKLLVIVVAGILTFNA